VRTCRALLVVIALTPIMTACGATAATTPSPAPNPSPSAPTRAAAERFLTRYVTSDGRIIRHDQGGDIVSEGQAYGMLIAEVAQQPAVAHTIWSWTAAHLANSHGLIASHATASGQIEDPHSATDADILIAYALLRYAGADQAALHRDGRRIADAVLSQESVTLPAGAPLPVAGPWAKATETVDPSYLMPSVFAGLAGLTGDDRWNRAAAGAVAQIATLTNGGRLLPPDWARLSGDRLVPIADPGGGAGVQYSFDAARLPIWFATGCTADARNLAAAWWRNLLVAGGRSGPQALTLSGATINATPSPLPLMAGSAAAAAAGDDSTAGELRTRATTLARQDPTYYGDAWVALGPALLEGSISPCPQARA
jgi:endo-1,4-beta-D-glucanase Y